MERLSAGNLQERDGAALVRTDFLAGLPRGGGPPARSGMLSDGARRPAWNWLRACGIGLRLARKAAGREVPVARDSIYAVHSIGFVSRIRKWPGGEAASVSVPVTIPGILRLPGTGIGFPWN